MFRLPACSCSEMTNMKYLTIKEFHISLYTEVATTLSFKDMR